MDIQELLSLAAPLRGDNNEPAGYNPTQYIEKIIHQWKPIFQLEGYKQYNVDFHDIVTNIFDRRDKEVFVPTGQKKENGEDIYEKRIVKTARLPVSYQKLITKRSAQFLTGGRVRLEAEVSSDTDKTLYTEVKTTWNRNKLQYKNGNIARAQMSQMEVVELWFSKPVKDQENKFELAVKILEPKDGFTFYPVFDSFGDLIAFGILWKEKIENDNDIEHFDLYTDTEIRRHIKDITGEWVIAEGANDEGLAIYQHGYGKMPIIYYTQSEPEWHDVQRLIKRYEELISNFADTNDYNGSPILFLKGTGNTLPAKGQSGKVIENPEGTGDAKYVTWDQAPESIKLEITKLESLIYTLTQTPPLDFESMKGLGELSGVAFDRVFVDAHLKAKEKQGGNYGEGIQRRLNFLKSAIISMNPELKPSSELLIEPEFELFSIDDDKDKVDVLTQATGGKPIMSQQTAIRKLGAVDDAETELEQIQSETDSLGNDITI